MKSTPITAPLYLTLKPYAAKVWSLVRKYAQTIESLKVKIPCSTLSLFNKKYRINVLPRREMTEHSIDIPEGDNW